MKYRSNLFPHIGCLHISSIRQPFDMFYSCLLVTSWFSNKAAPLYSLTNVRYESLVWTGLNKSVSSRFPWCCDTFFNCRHEFSFISYSINPHLLKSLLKSNCASVPQNNIKSMTQKNECHQKPKVAIPISAYDQYHGLPQKSRKENRQHKSELLIKIVKRAVMETKYAE